MELTVTLPRTQFVTTITPVATDGLMLFNDSDSVSVTVSTQGNVSPGAGIVIKPKGQITWAAPGAPIYGVSNSPVDTPLLVTDNVTDMASPLDIAIATASRLITQGVPNVSLTERIYAGTLNTPNSAGRLPLPVPVNRYASVILYINSNVPSELEVYSCQDDVIMARRSHQMFFPQITIAMPVMGNSIEFNQGVTCVAVGTNRPTDYQVLNPDVFGRYAGNGTISRGQNMLSKESGPSFIHKGGPVTVSTYVPQSTAVGIFCAQLSNTVVDLVGPADMVAGNAGKTFWVAQKTMNLPPGNYSFTYNAEAAGNFTPIIKVTAS